MTPHRRLVLSLSLAAFAGAGCESEGGDYAGSAPPPSAGESASPAPAAKVPLRERPGNDPPRHHTDWPDGARQHVLAGIEELNRQHALAMEAEGLLELAGTSWINVGGQQAPDGWIGRINDIAVDPTNANRMFVTTPGGGIWETTNAGTSWTPRADGELSMYCAGVGISASNPQIVYAWCGQEGRGNGGILKSTNGGATWQNQAPTIFAPGVPTNVSDVHIDPANPNVVVVNMTSWHDVPELGVYKTTNGGTTWTQKRAGGAMDLAVDPTNFGRQLAALGHQNSEGLGTMNGLYRSSDAGETWTLIDAPWVESQGGLMRVAIAPSQPSTAYVVMNDINGVIAFYRVTNIWTTPIWTPLAAPEHWVEDMIVEPTNPNIVIAGGYPWFFFFDGSSWVSRQPQIEVGNSHVDQQAFAFAGNKLIVGNDGGIYSTLDRGLNWVNLNSNLSITQFYFGSIHTSNAQFALGGTQDNGNQLWTGGPTWAGFTGGDGASAIVSPTNGYRHLAWSYVGGVVERTLDNMQIFEGNNEGIMNSGWATLVEGCPNNENVALLGGNDDLWKNTGFFNPERTLWSSNHPGNGTEIGGLAFASSDTSCGTYAFGTGDGLVFVTNNGGTTWRQTIPGGGTFDDPVTDLAFHPTDPNILYVTLGGFSEITPPGHIFKSTNAQAATPTWTNISHSVDLPHTAVALDPTDPNVLYVGSEIGVWVSTAAGAAGSWSHVGPSVGMPNVNITDIRVNKATNRVLAYTFGRGAIRISTGSTPPAVSVVPAVTTINAGQSLSVQVNATDPDNAVVKTELFHENIKIGERSGAGAIVWERVPAGTYDLRANATDAAGEVTTSAPVTVTVSPPAALFVASSTTLGAADAVVRDKLVSLGYAVTVRTGSSATTADATGKSLVVVSSTVNPTDVNTKFRTVAVPVLLWESQLFDDMGMTGTTSGTNFGTTTGQTQIAMVSGVHPVSVGVIGTVTASPTSSTFNWGVPNANAAIVANLASNPSRAAMFVYPRGAVMPGLTAPARRVGLFLGDTTAADLGLNASAMVTAAIQWATDSSPISARITGLVRNGSGSPVSGVTITLTGTTREVVQTNASGLYVLPTLPLGGSYTVTPTLSGTTFTPASRAVTAMGGDQTGDFTSGGGVVIPPAPTNLMATAGNAQVSLTWTASTGATSYTVLRGTVSGGPYTSVATGVTATSYTNTSLTNGTTYFFVVRAVNTAGTSGNSNQASATPTAGQTIPPAPTNLMATAGNAQVSLTWTASTGATSYTVLRGTASGGPYTSVATGVTATSYTNTSLTNGTTYFFVVRAVNTAGTSGNSNQASATPTAGQTIPPAPTNLMATAGNAQVSLTWTASAGATSYTVLRGTASGGPYTSVATGVSVTNYTNTGLTNGTGYFFVVRAVNTAGTSGNSNQASATPTVPPTGTLKAQYKVGDPGQPSDNAVKAHLKIANTGTASVALSTLKVRYWFTRDTAQSLQAFCDWSAVDCVNVTMGFVAVTGRTNADHYFEVGFSGSGTIAAGGNTGEIQTRFSKTDWSNFNETNDHSFDATKTAYADAPKITLYQNGTLVWGTEP